MNEENLPKELTSTAARRGKWTVEEERYTEQIIEDFDNGVLDVPDTTTLRTYLSKVLNCDPMRITKKYTGNVCIGKRTFCHMPLANDADVAYVRMCYTRLINLRQAWINKLLLTEQWNNRKLSFRGGVSIAPKVPLYSEELNPVSPFTFAMPSAAAAAGVTSDEQGRPVSPSNEVDLDSACAAVSAEASSEGSFSEVRVFTALRPFMQELSELERTVAWLKQCAASLSSGAGAKEAGLLDCLTAQCSLQLSSLYKVMLSGCLAEWKLLQSAVQAVFERLILANDAPRVRPAASMETVSDEEGEASQLDQVRAPFKKPRVDIASSLAAPGVVSPALCTPTNAAGEAGPVPQAVVSPLEEPGAALTLESCLSSLKARRAATEQQLLQGPITATAALYREQQEHKKRGSTAAAPVKTDLFTDRSTVSHLIDPELLSSRLTSSLNQSVVEISRQILEQQQVYEAHLQQSAYPSNIETAAEALLGLYY